MDAYKKQWYQISLKLSALYKARNQSQVNKQASSGLKMCQIWAA